MGLNNEQRRWLRHGIANERVGNEIGDAIDLGGNPVTANVPALGSTSDLVGVDGSGSNAAPLVGTEARLDAIEAKVDALLAAMVASGQMAT